MRRVNSVRLISGFSTHRAACRNHHDPPSGTEQLNIELSGPPKPRFELLNHGSCLIPAVFRALAGTPGTLRQWDESWAHAVEFRRTPGRDGEYNLVNVEPRAGMVDVNFSRRIMKLFTLCSRHDTSGVEW